MSSVWQQFGSSDFQRPFVILVGMAALECLVAIWAATSRAHWFWRALAVWAAFVVLIPIQAWEPVWMFGFAVPVIVGTILIGRWFTELNQAQRSTRWRFTLRDLMALVLTVALWLPVILEVVKAFHPRNWLGWFTCSAALALVALVAYSRAHTQRWPMRGLDWLQLCVEFGMGLGLISMFQASVTAYLAAYVVIGAIAVGLTLWGWYGWRQTIAVLLLLGIIPPIGQAVYWAGFWMHHEGPIRSTAFTTPAKIGMIDLFALELAWALIGLLLFAWVWHSAEIVRSRRTIAGAIVRVILCGWAISLCWTYACLLAIPSAPLVAAFISPINHYERIMAIAERAVVLSPGYESIASVRQTAPKGADELDTLCQELMPLLEAPNYVPYVPGDNGDYTWLCNHRHAVQMLPHILSANSTDCSEGKRFDAAADYALAIVRLGDLQCRGALETDFNIGTTIRRRGLRHLVDLRNELSPEATRKVIAALQRSIDGREDPEVGWARWLRYRQDSWDGWVLYLERILFERQERREFVDGTLVYERRQELAKRLLQAELAVRLFEQERGELPKRLNALVPDYLPAVPVDFNSRPLVLRIDSDGYVIHCDGWGGLEDGGRFSNWTSYPQQEGFGIDLDYLTRQQF